MGPKLPSISPDLHNVTCHTLDFPFRVLLKFVCYVYKKGSHFIQNVHTDRHKSLIVYFATVFFLSMHIAFRSRPWLLGPLLDLIILDIIVSAQTIPGDPIRVCDLRDR
jgi:hypothetical protein